MKKLTGIFLIAILGGSVGFGISKLVENKVSRQNLQTTSHVRYVNNPTSTPETAINFTKAAEMTIHGVVHVTTQYAQQQNPLYNDPFYQFFWGHPDLGQQNLPPRMSSGSGVIISDDGYIATNNHVVVDAEKIEVTLNDKRKYTATVIGTDPSTDLALLKIDDKNLPFISYGNSDDVKIGEWVLAVGNPFNLMSTVTAGIISAKGRNINILENNPNSGIFPIESFIQTDAAVNPGNSGGALVNTSGQLIGINAAIASNTGSYTGYSFAIPVNLVKKIMNDLLEFGKVQRAFMGVSIRDIDAKFAEEKGLKNLNGVYITGITEGGSAEEANIRAGDIILKIGNVTINSASELQEQINRFRPGEAVSVTVIRDGKEKIVPVKLKNKENKTEIVRNESLSLFGADFQPVSGEEKTTLNLTGGVKIVKLSGGKFRSAGIREGFIITNIDKKEIKTIEDLKNALTNKKGGVLIEGVYPNGTRAFYGFGL